jgi:hypothetical protein
MLLLAPECWLFSLSLLACFISQGLTPLPKAENHTGGCSVITGPHLLVFVNGSRSAFYLQHYPIGQQLHRHVTPLSEVQQHLLALLDLSPQLYDQLCADSSKPT